MKRIGPVTRSPVKRGIASLLVGLGVLWGFTVAAQGTDKAALSYSPEHWPSRWSSAVRQQEGTVFPDRNGERTIGSRDEFVTESDLFAKPGRRQDWDELGESDAWDRISAFEDRKFRNRRDRNRGRGLPPPPFGYPGSGYSNGYNAMYPAPYSGAGPMVWDPVLRPIGITARTHAL